MTRGGRSKGRPPFIDAKRKFPLLQAAETYNLSGILDAMKKGAHSSD